MRRKNLALFLVLTMIFVGTLSACNSSTAPATPATPAVPATPAAPDSSNAQESTPPQSAGVVKIGYIGAITGEGALLAEYELKGIRMAVDQINETGGINGSQIELIEQDSGGTNSGSVLATQKITKIDDVVALIGLRRSPHFMAASKYIEEAKIPIMTFGTAVQITTEGNPYVFRDRAHDGIATELMVKFAVETLGKQKLALLYDTDVTGVTGLDITSKFLKEKYDLEYVSTQGYQTGSKDWTPQLMNIKQSGAEVILGIGTNTQENAVIIRQIRQMGLDVEVVGPPTYSSPVMIELAGEYAEGLYTVTDWSVGLDDPKSLQFVKDFVGRYGHDPDYASSSAYDGMYILADAIKRAGPDREAITEAIRTTKDLVGVQATYNFDEHGDGCRTMLFTRVKNGVFEVLERISL